MCYGGLDPKYQMRDIEARVKSLTFEPDTQKQAVPVGMMARMRDVIVWLLQKDARHA